MKTYDGMKVYLHALPRALDGDKWSVSRPGRFTSRKEPPTPTEYEAGWAQEPVFMGIHKERVCKTYIVQIEVDLGRSEREETDKI
jgi:hypothetical protein